MSGIALYRLMPCCVPMHVVRTCVPRCVADIESFRAMSCMVGRCGVYAYIVLGMCYVVWYCLALAYIVRYCVDWNGCGMVLYCLLLPSIVVEWRVLYRFHGRIASCSGLLALCHIMM